MDPHPRWSRWSLATAFATVAVTAALTGACAADQPSASPGVDAPTETLAPFELDDAGPVDAGGCSGDVGGGAGGSSVAPAGSPLGAPGGRQLPGPSATVTSVPSSATSVVVQTPANPDDASPARQPDGSGTPTEPYVIGGAADAAPDAPTPSVATPSAPPTACGGGL
jgi:hypothetical protein